MSRKPLYTAEHVHKMFARMRNDLHEMHSRHPTCAVNSKRCTRLMLSYALPSWLAKMLSESSRASTASATSLAQEPPSSIPRYRCTERKPPRRAA